MTITEKYIIDGLKIIERFADEKNYQAALKGCQELLNINPYHRKLGATLRQIEEQILQENNRKVDEDIKATEKLWDEKRYDELFAIYTKLLQYAPNHTKLRRLFQKLSETLSENDKAAREKNRRDALKKMSAAMREGRFSEALEQSRTLLTLDPLCREAREFAQQASQAIVDAKLRENGNLALSGDYARQCEFYESLLSIFPQHEEVKRRLMQSREHLAKQNLLAAKIHLNESVARMKEIFQKAEYEQVLQSCEEILRLDSKNFAARLYRKKALSMIRDEVETLALEYMQKAAEELRTEFEKNPAGFAQV